MTDDGRYDDEDEKDEFHDNLIKWNETAFEKYLKKFLMSLPESERIANDIDIIDEYYPGSNALRDDEVIRRKYYPSEHSFQLVIAIKRMLEQTGKGTVYELPDGWRFGSGCAL